jgi:thioredoxin reductase
MNHLTYDVAIIGAGAAGLAAATVLARAHRKVLLVDNGKQSNLLSQEAHAVFTRDKTQPSELYRIANEQLAQYESVEITRNTIVSVKKIDDTFALISNEKDSFNARVVLLSQGMKYEPVDIPGVLNLFGHKAWHCPYCDGYEAEGKKVLAIHDQPAQQHMKKILPIWIEDIHFKTPTEIKSVSEVEDGVVVTLLDESVEFYDQLVVQTVLTQRDNLYKQLGCELSDTGRLKVNQFNSTTIPGVFAAGDQMSEMSQVNIAVASGHLAAIGINSFLLIENK